MATTQTRMIHRHDTDTVRHLLATGRDAIEHSAANAYEGATVPMAIVAARLAAYPAAALRHNGDGTVTARIHPTHWLRFRCA